MTTSAPNDLIVAETLDCTGLLCPLPVYKTALALGKLQPGDILELICTDPGSLEDIPAMARQRGDVLRTSRVDGDTQTFWIEKGSVT